jgi:chromosome segregation ATPase
MPDSKPSAGEPELLSVAWRTARTLTEDLDHVTDTLRALVFSANEASSRVGSLRRTHLELRADLERAEKVMAEREQLASTLANRLSELAAELALQQGQWKDQETEIAQAHARSQAALRAQLTDLDGQRSELAAVLETERADKAALAARITELQAEFEAERAESQAAFDARLRAREAELKAELEQALERAARADQERAFALEEQERFVKSVVDEYEAKLGALTQSRDEAVGRAEELAAKAGALRRAGSGAPTLKFTAAPSTDSDPLALRVRELEEQAEQVQHERELSREVLRRLQLQRDEAQEAAARLTREVEALRHAAPAVPVGHKSATAPTLPDLPRVSVPASANVDGAAGGPEAPLSAPQPPEVERAPAPSSPRSALAAALAASDPTHRRPPAEAPVKPKPGWSTRPLVGYSKRDVEPDDVRRKPPRRHGG